jgi:hypothetical protein
VAGVGTTHHVKLGNEYLILRPNTYQKKPAPTFGARITTGDPDYNNLSFWQHWVQKCWVGGMGAEEWIDDAMFDVGVGVDVTDHERVTLGRSLKRGVGSNWDIGGRTNSGRVSFVAYKSLLYAIWHGDGTVMSRMYEYNPGTDGWDNKTIPSNMAIHAAVAFDGYLIICGKLTTGAAPKVYKCSTVGTWTAITLPASVNAYSASFVPRAMRIYNAKLYIAFGTIVWRMNDQEVFDGTQFYRANANSGSSYIVSFETHLGFLYMLSQNGHLHRTDGNNTFDIWSWDGQTAGTGLRSYDGKLFVATYEYSLDASQEGVGVLYQFTGAAVTELKRWGKPDKVTRLGNMVVWNRKLFYGAGNLFNIEDGFGIAVYDAIEDAHSLWAQNVDIATYTDRAGDGADWLVNDIFVFGGRMYCSVTGHGIFFTPVGVRDLLTLERKFIPRPAVAGPGSGGYIQSSMYDAGTPGLEKLWRKITVYCDLPASTSMRLYYSTATTDTWVALPAVSGAQASSQFTFYLNNVRGPRFRYKIYISSTVDTATPILRGIIVAYIPQPEPNWMWTFTVPVADKWVLVDESEEVKSTNALIAYLEGLYRAGDLVTFIDLDGVSWGTNGPGVLIYDMSTVHYDVEAPNREGDIRITLLEAVETY